MNRKAKALVILLLVAILAGGAVWYIFRQSGLIEEASKLAENIDVDVSMKGLTLTQGEDGDLLWKLTATGAEYLKEEGRIRVDDPRIKYYPKNSDLEYDVSAPKGEVDQNTEEAWLWPEVLMRSGESEVTAEKLHYVGADRTILLSGGVVLIRPDMRVESKDAVVDLTRNRVEATGGVRAVIRGGVELKGKQER